MKTVAIIQARMGSTRLPGKVLMQLATKPVLQWVVEAASLAMEVDQVVVATSMLRADDKIANWCAKNDVNCFRGSESDVLDRFRRTAWEYEANIVLRLTADCPFHDPEVIDQVVRLRKMTGASYCSNTEPPTWPDGLDVECFTFEALDAAHQEAVRQTDRDCVTRFIVRNQHRFPAATLTCPLPGLHKERWVLDTAADYEFCKALARQIAHPSYLEILRILDVQPQLRELNAGHIRNERFYEGLAEEEKPEPDYAVSNHLFQQAKEIIPTGAQTFSKSHLQYPAGDCPLFVTHGDGAYVFDVDGNDYIDLVGGLLPVVLGYRDPDVDAAVRRQLSCGISFTLSSPLETKLAEKLIEHIPCAEMVKFGKNGTDVTTAAVRVARAYTGRYSIAMKRNAYHGWADWSVGNTPRGLGVPPNFFPRTFDDPVGLFQHVHSDNLAAVIVEPELTTGLELATLRKLCTQYGIILIFDEIITGFRWGLSGAQGHHNVMPDLACFGKAMGNGMPISALVGKREIMQRFAPPDNCFVSGTFFGETLSIAAALAVIEKMEREPVAKHIWDTGEELANKVWSLLAIYNLTDVIKLKGLPCLTRLEFSTPDIKALFIKEMARHGVLILASHNLSYAHKAPEVKRILKAYEETIKTISVAVHTDQIPRAAIMPSVRG